MEGKEPLNIVDIDYDSIPIKNLIYFVRDQQVMMDSDLAALYQVETKALNRSVIRNISRFPESFRFQITKDEYENLRYQIGTSSLDSKNNSYGGRRYMPYVFTEQGIAMLSSVLRSEIAISVSIRIMQSFVEMRKYMANTSLIHERLSNMEVRQINYQKITDERLDKIFDYIAAHEESERKVFFDGQIYDAFSKIAELIHKADSELILIDNYVDIKTLNLLSKKKKNVVVTVYTLKSNMLSNADVQAFNAQYPLVKIKYTKKFHDRFLIVDSKYGYHIGASIKDAGKKCFGINLIQEMDIVNDILLRL